MKGRGSSVDSGIMLEGWMRAEPELTDIKYETKWIPIGPWDHGTVLLVRMIRSLKLTY